MQYTTTAPTYTHPRLSANSLELFLSFTYFGAHKKDWAAHYTIYDNWAIKGNDEELRWKFRPFPRAHEQPVKQNAIDSSWNQSYQWTVPRADIRADTSNDHRETTSVHQASTSLQELGSTSFLHNLKLIFMKLKKTF